ncbi:unnamed protein product [Mycena citricolor]|uniref:Uncharacterized protein n=1 Tax=Mycena citricolor TaxID=2018698 RepID=A0AAD2H2R4_9AGAR|nr:unnamed protein product [Mycena citricolor]
MKFIPASIPLAMAVATVALPVTSSEPSNQGLASLASADAVAYLSYSASKTPSSVTGSRPVPSGSAAAASDMATRSLVMDVAWGVTRLVNVMNVLPNVAYSRGGAHTIIVKLLLLVAELSSSMTGLPSRALTPDEVLGINVALRTLQNSLTQLLFASPSIPTPVLATLKPLSGPLSQVATVLGYSGPASTISNVLDRLPV